MFQWLRRLLTIVWFGGWVGLILFIIGIPGLIEDLSEWQEWMGWLPAINPWPVLALSLGFIVSGPLVWTSGWWHPRLMKAFRRRQGKELEQQEAKKAFRDFQRTSQGVKGTIIEARQNEIEQRLARLENRSGNQGGGLSATVKVKKRRSPEAEELHALVPLIERQMKASRPNTLMRTVWRTILWTTPSDTRVDYLELVATLNAIGVAYPEHVPGDESWFVFLVELLVLAKAGDIAKARASYSRVTPNG